MNCPRCECEMTQYGNETVSEFLCEPCENMISTEKTAAEEKTPATRQKALDDMWDASNRLAKMLNRLTHARCEVAFCMKAASRLEAEMQKAIERAAAIQEEKEVA